MVHDPQADPAIRAAALIVLARLGDGGQLRFDLEQMLLSPSDYVFARGTLQSLLTDKTLRGLSTTNGAQIKEILREMP